MGIPHGNGMQRQNNRFDRPRIQDTQSRSPIRSNNEFQSFEDTFKPVKKPIKTNRVTNSAQKQPMNMPPPAEDFDNTPLPAMKNQQVNDFDNMPISTMKNQQVADFDNTPLPAMKNQQVSEFDNMPLPAMKNQQMAEFDNSGGPSTGFTAQSNHKEVNIDDPPLQNNDFPADQPVETSE